MTDQDNSWLDRFESIGLNCEFGFVLNKLGYKRPSLFRWTYITAANLRRALEGRFQGCFAMENLKPTSPRMVRDNKYHWGFHSALHSDQNKTFIASGDALKRLHRIESAKIANDINIFSERLASGGIICVLLARSMSNVELAKTLKSIDDYAGNQSNQILVVTECDDSAPTPGQVLRISPRIVRGVITRLAPSDRATDADHDNWVKVLRSVV